MTDTQKSLILICFFSFHFSLPKGGLALGRQEVHAVAEQRKHEIARFLKSLFSSQLARESDLVYTFFHPLLRDQQDADTHLPKTRTERYPNYSKEFLETFQYPKS